MGGRGRGEGRDWAGVAGRYEGHERYKRYGRYGRYGRQMREEREGKGGGGTNSTREVRGGGIQVRKGGGENKGMSIGSPR